MSTDLLSLPVLSADHRISYGPDPSQFGDLWLPHGVAQDRLPVVIFFHGGWWKSEYDLGYAGYLCAALRSAGFACWSVEYRRVGATGGGWPRTFQDAAAGVDFVATLAKRFPLDIDRVITMGHSAGGHLAFWATGRHHIDPASELHLSPSTVALKGTVSLAGAVDLRLTIDLSGYFTFAHDKHEVYNLMGGKPKDLPARYQAGNPGDLLPFSARQVLLQGSLDDQIPADLPRRWTEMAHRSGSHADFILLGGLDHFDVVDPRSSAWPLILKETSRLLAR